MKKTILIIGIFLINLSLAFGISSSDLFGYYSFDSTVDNENTDTSGTYDWTLTSGTQDLTTGFINNGVQFTTDYYIANDYKNAIDVNEGAINFWIKPNTGDGNNENYIFRTYTSSPFQRFYIFLDSSQNFHISMGGFDDTNPVNLNVGSWSMITLRWQNATKVEIYYNGSYHSTQTVSWTTTSWDGQPFNMGCDSGGCSGSDFEGMLDELSFWDRWLSDSDISDLWNSGEGLAYPFGTPDNTFPTWENLTSNNDNETYFLDIVQFNVSIADDTNLSNVIFSTNQTGSWVNLSSMDVSGTELKIVYNLTITASYPNIICSLFHFNDTSDNKNTTDSICFQVNESSSAPIQIIRDIGGLDRTIFYDNGDAEFNGTIWYDDAIERTMPFYTDRVNAYKSILKVDTSSSKAFHETTPKECYRSGGTSTTCLVKALIKSVQEIEIRSNKKNYFNLDIKDVNNRVDKIELDYEVLKKDKNNVISNITNMSKEIKTKKAIIEDIDSNTIMADEIYTKSKVPEPTINYCQMIADADIYNKSNHYAYRYVRGRYVLDAEYRWVVLEGCEKQKLSEMCIIDKNKYSWCTP